MNEIHSTCIIGENVTLGKGNKILPYTVIDGHTEIGDNNTIGPHVCIGMPGENTKDPYYDNSKSKIKIGNRNIIREFTSIQQPCLEEYTVLEDDIFIMHGVHIPHDCHIYSKVVITPLCVLGGHTKILQGANIGMAATIHQFCVIGAFSIIATNSAVTKNIKPFSKYIPNKKLDVNTYAIIKNGYNDFESEIVDYLENDKPPISKEIISIYSHFEDLHQKSNRKLY